MQDDARPTPGEALTLASYVFTFPAVLNKAVRSLQSGFRLDVGVLMSVSFVGAVACSEYVE